jgi:5-methyltetrahydrofolate corrinoid/iron sulfur protein methyltransferase
MITEGKMLVIANNITSRNPRVAAILKEYAPENSGRERPGCPGLKDIAESCANAGADVLEINLQQHLDRPEVMELAVRVVQESTGRQLCLSSNHSPVIRAGLKLCTRPPVINYLSLDAARLQEILPLAAESKADLILLISDPARPADAAEMLEKAAVLIGAANEAGVPNERIILDPGIFHITGEQGQQHLAQVLEVLKAVPETFGPAVRTTCWLSNASAGAPVRTRAIIDSSLLALLAGAGISSVFLDVLKKENQRTLRLLRVFKNEEVYADDLLMT